MMEYHQGYMMEYPSLALARGSLCGQFLCLSGRSGLVSLGHFLGGSGNVFLLLHLPHDRRPNFRAQS